MTDSYTKIILKVESWTKNIDETKTTITLSCNAPINIEIGDEIELWIIREARLIKKKIIKRTNPSTSVDEFNIFT